jgi:hypothetical protein
VEPGSLQLTERLTMTGQERAVCYPQRSNLTNMKSMAVDSKGRPFIATSWRPAGEQTEQIHVILLDGTKWQLRRVGQRVGYPIELRKGSLTHAMAARRTAPPCLCCQVASGNLP